MRSSYILVLDKELPISPVNKDALHNFNVPVLARNVDRKSLPVCFSGRSRINQVNSHPESEGVLS